MRSVEDQQARVQAAAVAPRPVRVAIAEAQGLMCAEEVVTEYPLPGFDQAAIDGYAVRSVDVLGVGDPGVSDTDRDGPGEVSLPVIDTIGAAPGYRVGCSPGRPRACRRCADAHPGRCRAAVALDRRR